MDKVLLVITRLFPNSVEPTDHPFNKNQIFALKNNFKNIVIIAPISWTLYIRKKYFIKFKKVEKDENIIVYHPIFIYIPRIFRSLQGFFYVMSIFFKYLKVVNNYKVDFVYSTWLYPDGYASFLLSRLFRKPIFVKAHGSDVNYFSNIRSINNIYKSFLPKVNGIITVSEDLNIKIRKILSNNYKHLITIYNGIDLDRFSIKDKIYARKKLQIGNQGKILLYVGNLKKSKGILKVLHFYYEYFNGNDNKLFFIGDGVDQNLLELEIKNLCLESTVKIVERQDNENISVWINAADFLILLSENEGMPNVILEALACGVPVITNGVGGTMEIFKEEDCGINVNNPATNIKNKLESKFDRSLIRSHIEDLSWQKNAEKLLHFFTESLKN